MFKVFLPRLVVSILGIMLPLAAHADERVTVGDQTIAIPLPTGFVRLDGRNAKLDEALKSFVAPMNTGLAAFALEADANGLAAGRNVVMRRYFLLQTLSSAVGKKLTLSDFKDAKKEIEKLIAKSGSLDDAKTQANDALKKSGIDDIKIGSVKSIGVFDSGEDFIETGMIMRMSPTDPPIVNISSTLIANGKILYAYGYSQYNAAEDIEWTKAAVKSWRQAILAANPGGTEKGHLRIAGFDLGRAGNAGLIGGAVGAIIAVVIARRKKS